MSFPKGKGEDIEYIKEKQTDEEEEEEEGHKPTKKKRAPKKTPKINAPTYISSRPRKSKRKLNLHEEGDKNEEEEEEEVIFKKPPPSFEKRIN